MSSVISSIIELNAIFGKLRNGASVITTDGHVQDGIKLTKSGKPRKVSDRKGKPSARTDFNKMICKEKAEEFDAFKATLATKQGAQFSFMAKYNKENPEAYPAFEVKWQAEQQGQAQQQQAQQQPLPKEPVKTAKKAITTQVVAPIQAAIPDELLPFTIGDKTYLRLGMRRENGNHLWTSGHLWMSKKGAKGGHYGELQEDGSINMDADEPTF